MDLCSSETSVFTRLHGIISQKVYLFRVNSDNVKWLFSTIGIEAGTCMVKYSFISYIKVNIFSQTLYIGLLHILSVVIGLVHFSNGSYNAVILMKIQSA